MPFPLRRLWLLARGALIDRERPDLDHLAAINDPERFVWAILPHAARSFAPSILLLPEAEARAAAVGYLYARILDTYEDLPATPKEGRVAIARFADRFEEGLEGEVTTITHPRVADQRDELHLLLMERHRLVDEVFISLPTDTRSRISRLVEDMASGMIEYSTIFETQGGVLISEEQVLDYCHHVIGLPALFMMEMLLGDITGDHFLDALEVSELIQLANITRDVEKDLLRGVAYHPALATHLGSDGFTSAAPEVAIARRELMLLATRRAPSFRRLISEVGLPRLSPARAAAVMMMLYTDRHYRSCAVNVGIPTWSGPRRLITMILTSIPAAVSPRWANRVLLRVERDLLAAA